MSAIPEGAWPKGSMTAVAITVPGHVEVTRMARHVDAIGIDEAGLKLAAACGARRTLRPEQTQRGAYSLVIEASGSSRAFIQTLQRRPS